MKQETAIKLLEKVRTTYDTIAADFDRTRQRVWPEFDRFSSYLTPNMRILDVGCGNGRLLKFLDGKNFKSYKGIDNSTELLALAKKQHQGSLILFKEGTLTNLPVKNGGYDAVFSIAALHHVPSRELQLKALGECNRTMTSNGLLFLTVWDLARLKSLPYFIRSFFRTIFSLGNYSFKDLFVPWGKKSPQMRYCYAFSMPELRRLVSDAGFEVMESWTVGTGKSGNHVIVARPFVPASIRPGMRIMGVDFDAVTLKEATEFVGAMIRSGRQHVVVTPNPEILLKAEKDVDYRKILSGASLKIADGAGILWASLVVHSTGVKRVFRGLFELAGMVVMPWRSKSVFPERVTGVDLMTEILDKSFLMKAKVFLLGAGPGVADAVAQKWRVADIVGTYSGSPGSKDEKTIIDRVNASGANVLFVAYGAPAQEKWIHRNLKKMPNVKVAMGVGGAFDFVAGVQSRAPEWMGQFGIEWLWRVVRQPRRIVRIFNATVRFPWRVIGEDGHPDDSFWNVG